MALRSVEPDLERDAPTVRSVEQRVLARVGVVTVAATFGVLLFAVWAGIVLGLGWLIFTTIWGVLT